MPSDEFWRGNPQYFNSYVEAYRLKKSREDEAEAFNTDYQAWLVGLYVQQALSIVLSGAFGKRGGKRAQYPKEPLSFSKRKSEDREKKQEQENALLQKQYSDFRRFVDAMNQTLR